MENDMIRRSELTGFFDRKIRLYEPCPDKYDAAIELKIASLSIPAADAVEVSGDEKRAVELIVAERQRQKFVWGDQSDVSPYEFVSILGEEYGELCEAINETYFQHPKKPERGGTTAIVREAAQVAAVAIQIIEAFLPSDNIWNSGMGIENKIN